MNEIDDSCYFRDSKKDKKKKKGEIRRTNEKKANHNANIFIRQI